MPRSIPMIFEEVMKSVILSLPPLIALAYAAALHAQVASTALPLTLQQPDAEIRELRQELDAINARLGILEAEGQNALSRGLDSETSGTPGSSITRATPTTRDP